MLHGGKVNTEDFDFSEPLTLSLVWLEMGGVRVC